MANKVEISELFKWDPDLVGDPVPPWLFQALDRVTLRDLAVISLERSRAIQDINSRAIDGAIAVIKKAKF